MAHNLKIANVYSLNISWIIGQRRQAIRVQGHGRVEPMEHEPDLQGIHHEDGYMHLDNADANQDHEADAESAEGDLLVCFKFFL